MKLMWKPWGDVYVDDFLVGSGIRTLEHSLPDGAHAVRIECTNPTSCGGLPPEQRQKTYPLIVNGAPHDLGYWDFLKQAP